MVHKLQSTITLHTVRCSAVRRRRCNDHSLRPTNSSNPSGWLHWENQKNPAGQQIARKIERSYTYDVAIIIIRKYQYHYKRSSHRHHTIHPAALGRSGIWRWTSSAQPASQSVVSPRRNSYEDSLDGLLGVNLDQQSKALDADGFKMAQTTEDGRPRDSQLNYSFHRNFKIPISSTFGV